MAAYYNKDDERCIELLHKFYACEITPAELARESEKMIIKQLRLDSI